MKALNYSVFALVLPVIFTLQLNAQRSNTDIVSSAGGSACSPQGICVSWTVGDIIIGENKNSRKWILNGFQQGILDTLRPKGDLDTLPPLTGIENIQRDIFVVSIYPNPVQDELNYKIECSEDFNFNVSLIDFSGKILWTEKNRKSKDSYTRVVSALNRGVYLFRVDIPRYGIRKTYKIIKQ
ncbi:MAG: T9SS type A sorting domain-containing protein [Bacteroidales bacterium]|jgi:hypothetical protein|nr:T9SS type A sorting domain-containing protein [Bacteroidales bacterium]